MTGLPRIFKIYLGTGIAVLMVLAAPVLAQDNGPDSANLADLWRAQMEAFDTDPGGDACTDAELSILEYLRDHGIERSVTMAAAYTQLGRTVLSEGDRDAAQWAFSAALNMDTNYVQAANASIFNGFHLGIGTGYSALLHRVKILWHQLTDFRLGMILLGNIAMSLQLAIVLAMFVTIILVMIRHFPLAVHELQAHTRGILNIRITGILLAALLLGLWFTPMGVAGALVIWLALAFLFSDKSHRIVLWTVWGMLFLSVPLTYFHVFSIRTAENPYFRIQEYVAGGGYSKPAVDEIKSLMEEPESAAYRGKLHFMLGLLYKRGGFYSDARNHFEEYVERAPRDTGGYINLGNIAFIENRVKSATEMYRKAETINPRNPVIFYNLSKAYMSQFRFDDARDMQNRASRLNRDLVLRFSENQSSKPVRMMVDETVPADWFNDEIARGLRESMRDFQDYWRPRFVSLNFVNALIVYGVLTLVFIAIRLLAERCKLSRFCLKCGNAMKPDPRTGGTDFVCVDCHMVYFKKQASTGPSREEKNKKIEAGRNWNLWLHKVFSCVVPGGGRIYSGKGMTGLLLLIPWSLFVSIILLKDQYLPVHYHVPVNTSGLDNWVLGILLVVTYGISIVWGFREEEA